MSLDLAESSSGKAVLYLQIICTVLLWSERLMKCLMFLSVFPSPRWAPAFLPHSWKLTSTRPELNHKCSLEQPPLVVQSHESCLTFPQPTLCLPPHSYTYFYLCLYGFAFPIEQLSTYTKYTAASSPPGPEQPTVYMRVVQFDVRDSLCSLCTTGCGLASVCCLL